MFKDCESEAMYRVTFDKYYNKADAMCRNRNYDIIAILEEYGDEGNYGILIILPQFKDIYKLLNNLFQEILPIHKPELFPDFVKNVWVDNEEYILPEVKGLIDTKEKMMRDYEKQIDEIDEKILDMKAQYDYLTGLLTSDGQGDFLVNNVMKMLEYIGYNIVVNVDDIVEGNKQEDLRILDKDRFTVIEVKGHNGNPSEDDCQALLKYINRNMRTERRTDIHGILIVNHHKLKAPLDRPDPAFTEQQISDAIGDNYTLVSTWELYKSVRLFQKGLISFDDIDSGLHEKGLFKALPSPWQFLGKIQHQFKDNTIACFILEADRVNIGDELVIENGNEYFKIDVSEMQIDDKKVENAKKGDKLAISVGVPILKQANIYVKNK